MTCLLRCLLLAVVWTQAHSYNILMMLPFGSRSHKNVFDPIAEVLAKNGHQVTLMAPIKEKNEVKGVRNVHLKDVDAAIAGHGVNFFQGTIGDRGFMEAIFDLVEDICKATYNEPEVQSILQGQTPKYDVLVIDQSFNDFLLALGHQLSVPVVYLSAYFLNPSVAWSLNVPTPLSYVPAGLSIVSEPMTFLERAQNALITFVFMNMFHGTMFPRFEAVIKNHIPDSPSLLELERNVSLVLINTNPAIHPRRPTMSYVQEVGCLHCKPAQSLPQDLEDFLQQSEEDGAIYFSLGSVTKGIYMPEEMRHKIIEVFGQLPQKVLWKYEGDIPDLPKHVKLIKWAPQQDLLGHPKVRLFITHGGGLSTQEASYHGCPLLGFPLSGDQLGNVANARNLGYAEHLDWKTFTARELLETIRTMLRDKRYKERATHLSRLLKDHAQPPAERAAYWIEYVVRHQGAPHLKTAAQHLNFVQYFLLDVLGAVALMAIVVLSIACFMLKKVTAAASDRFRAKSRLTRAKKLEYRRHKNVFDPIAEVLGKKGHQVTLMAPLQEKVDPPGVRNVFLKGIEDIRNKQTLNFFDGSFDDPSDDPDFVNALLSMLTQICNATYHEPEVQLILQGKSPKYDVLVLDQSISNFALPLGHRLAVPIIYLSTFSMMPWVVWNLKDPSLPSYIHLGMSVVNEPMTFMERVQNALAIVFFIDLFHSNVFPKFESIVWEHIPDSPPLLEVERNVSMVLLNTNPAIHPRRPAMPYVKEVGCVHCRPVRPLPKDLEDFLQESGEDGTIYFSLDSVTKGTYIPEDMKRKVMEVFGQLPQKVLWKYEGEIPDLPKNVKLIKWAPHQDLLGHPKVRLFISDGGVLSTQEAPYHGCPLLGFPLSGGQLEDVANGKTLGYAEHLDWKTFTAEELLETVLKMLTIKRYKERAAHLSRLLQDHPQPPAERAAYWIEYVVRHNGAPHLKSAAQHLNFVQYFLLDILGAVALVVIVDLAIACFVLKKNRRRGLQSILRHQEKGGTCQET